MWDSLSWSLSLRISHVVQHDKVEEPVGFQHDHLPPIVSAPRIFMPTSDVSRELR